MGLWNRLTVALAGTTALLTLALGFALLRPEPPPPVSRQVLSTEGWAGLAVQFGLYAAIAPDGSSMILPVGSGPSVQLAVKMRGSTEIRSHLGGTDGTYTD